MNIIPFDFEENNIRIIMLNDQAHFVAADITSALRFTNGSKAVKDNCDVEDITAGYPLLTKGGEQKVTLINEIGLYSLILKSRLGSAKRFKKWVTSEVLPSIRKTGGYEVDTSYAIPKTYREALLLAAAQEEKIEQQLLIIQEQKPKVEALERLTKLDGSVTITNAAKNINVAPHELFDWMSRKKWIYKRKDFYGNKIGNWLAYQDKIKSGYLELKPVKIIKEFGNNVIEEQTLVTSKGLARLAQLVNFSTDSY